MKPVLIALALLVTSTNSLWAGGSRRPREVVRRTAWLEGDVQTGFSPQRQIAEKKLQQWEGKAPDMSNVEDYLNFVSVLDASGRHSEAGNRLHAFLVKNPDEKRAVFLLGVHFMRVKRKELASYIFKQLEKDPQFPHKSLVLNNLGMLALEDRNRQEAIFLFEKATQSDPATPAPFVNLGAMYLQSHSWVGAEQLFQRALDMDDEFEDAALGLGLAQEGQGKIEQARKTYANFIDDNPEALSIVYNHAVLLGNRLKQKDQAAKEMLRYIQRGGKETAKAQEILRSWR